MFVSILGWVCVATAAVLGALILWAAYLVDMFRRRLPHRENQLRQTRNILVYGFVLAMWLIVFGTIFATSDFIYAIE